MVLPHPLLNFALPDLHDQAQKVRAMDEEPAHLLRKRLQAMTWAAYAKDAAVATAEARAREASAEAARWRREAQDGRAREEGLRRQVEQLQARLCVLEEAEERLASDMGLLEAEAMESALHTRGLVASLEAQLREKDAIIQKLEAAAAAAAVAGNAAIATTMPSAAAAAITPSSSSSFLCSDTSFSSSYSSSSSSSPVNERTLMEVEDKHKHVMSPASSASSSPMDDEGEIETLVAAADLKHNHIASSSSPSLSSPSMDEGEFKTLVKDELREKDVVLSAGHRRTGGGLSSNWMLRFRWTPCPQASPACA